MKHAVPGPAAHIAATLLTLLLTLCVMLTCVTFTANLALTDRTMHERVALDASVVDAQMTRIEAQIDTLAAKYHFSADNAKALVTRESVEAYNKEVISWWMGLLQAEPTYAAPKYVCDTLEQTILDDPDFRANTATGQVKTVARDKCAAGITSAVVSAVLPVRHELITFAMPQVTSRINVPHYMNYLSLAPIVFGLLSLVLCDLTGLVMAKRRFRSLMYIGAGLTAGGLVVLALTVLISMVGIPDMLAELSVLAGMQAALLAQSLSRMLLFEAAGCMLVGMLIMAQHQRKLDRLSKQTAAPEVAA